MLDTYVSVETSYLQKNLTGIKLKAKDCAFGNPQNNLVKDRIVCGIQNKYTQDLLFQNCELMLKTAIDKF